jgi:Flavodoxin
MKAAVLYESMFGNTRTIAESIAKGLAEFGEVQTLCVAEDHTSLPENVDLLVVGGPTHAWSMSRPSTRRSAPGYAKKPNSGLTLEAGADMAMGVREWLAAPGVLPSHAAAFDTRVKGPSVFTGRASRAIAKALAAHGARLVLPPQSFLVSRKGHLLSDEKERAQVWGRRLAEAMGITASASHTGESPQA